MPSRSCKIRLSQKEILFIGMSHAKHRDSGSFSWINAKAYQIPSRVVIQMGCIALDKDAVAVASCYSNINFFVGSVVKKVKASFLQRPCSHHLSSTRILVTLLRPWIRRFTMFISASWLRTSSKFTWEEVNRHLESLEYGQLLRGWGRFVQNNTATVASSSVEDEYGSSKSKYCGNAEFNLTGPGIEPRPLTLYTSAESTQNAWPVHLFQMLIL